MTPQEDRSAFNFEAKLSAERARLVGLCARLIGDVDAAEDLAQETLIEAWRHRERLYDPDGFSAWTSAIARNVCRRWERERGQQRVGNRHTNLDDITSPGYSDRAAADFDVELELERDELSDLLDRAMEFLMPEARAILIQRCIEDRPHTEIAERLGISEGAVRVKLHRGKLAMKRLLTQTFQSEAAAYGLVRPEAVAWQETRIWCPLCGKRHFLGRFEPADGTFELRCPDCYAATGVYTEYTSTALFEGLAGYKAAFNRVMRFVVLFYQQALVGRSVPCPNCERGHMLLYLSPPPAAGPLSDETRGMHLRCGTCLSVMSMRLSNLVLYQPCAWEFWRHHPRIHLLPERSIEVDGRSALVLSYRSLQDTARLDAVVGEDTYEILSIHQVPGG